ncbi:MAG: dTMP kinase [Planctomycetota bacterium]
MPPPPDASPPPEATPEPTPPTASPTESAPLGPAPPIPWLERLRGKFMVFDGPDGSGKSTQLARFRHDLARAHVPLCEVRDPGGTAVGDRVRAVLLDPDDGCAPSPVAEMLLFMASRAQLLHEHIRPALARHELVLADRFVSSTLAYQGSAGGLPIDHIRNVANVVVGESRPDLVVIFDVDEHVAATRMSPLLRGREFAGDRDRMELKGAGFHRKVRQGFLDQAAAEPDRYLVVDARQAPDDVYAELLAGLEERFGH